MISPEYCQTMARYNAWQNRSLYREADAIDDQARRLDRGAFFNSIQATLSHIHWGDCMWMSRFDGWERPGAHEMIDDWDELKALRLAADEKLAAWAAGLQQSDLDGDLSWYSGILKAEFCKPKWMLITHLFNHQTHHRGQVHAMLTAAGGTPDATDLGFMADDI